MSKEVGAEHISSLSFPKKSLPDPPLSSTTPGDNQDSGLWLEDTSETEQLGERSKRWESATWTCCSGWLKNGDKSHEAPCETSST